MKYVFLYLSLLLLSCGTDDGQTITMTNLPNTSGLLGQRISLDIAEVNFDSNIQVFFGNEQTSFFIQESGVINILIPRSLDTAQKNIEVIDLNTNETIAVSNFSLLSPSISGYSTDQAIFGEPFEIFGENFDIDIDDIIVEINNESAQILESSYNSITVLLPSFIVESHLNIEVTAQRQIVVDDQLDLLEPILTIPDGTNVFYGEFAVQGIGLNPESLGSVFVDDVEARFYVANDFLVVDIPPGIYDDFTIQELRYEYAGFVTVLDAELSIVENAILVDQNPNVTEHSYVFDQDIYGLGNLNDFDDHLDPIYALFKFETDTEKWERIGDWEFEGIIEFTVFDNIDRIYLQKTPLGSDPVYEWSFIDLNSFEETLIETPVSSTLYNSNVFAFQDGLFVLGGFILTPDDTIDIQNFKLKLNRNTLEWEELPSNALEGFPLPEAQNGGNVFNPRHADGKLFLSQFDSFNPTIIVNADFSVETLNQQVSFIIDNYVIVKSGNILRNLQTGNQIDFNGTVPESIKYVGGEFYYISINEFNYFSNEYLTARFKPGIFNALF
ncbi:IPT/TIG domain-containing protein [uncultured Dokdonia sp.]|uniref:IPT/TIG domain-containing protein n=1 Tax=Dokdonia sp. R78006 TaxID=3093866 RepID=UPI00260654E8|nr:IPT/TIG domain-containing protein [uncultured Dokdonia sp.]